MVHVCVKKAHSRLQTRQKGRHGTMTLGADMKTRQDDRQPKLGFSFGLKGVLQAHFQPHENTISEGKHRQQWKYTEA